MASRASPSIVAGLFGLLGLVHLVGCGKKEIDLRSAPAMDVVPASMHGQYGQAEVHGITSVSEVPFLTVTGQGLALSYGIEVEILDAELTGETVQIKLARVSSPFKSEIKPCMGSLTLRDDKLLISLFDTRSDDKCDASFALNSWIRWGEVERLEPPFVGRFLQGSPSGGRGTVVEVEETEVRMSGATAAEPVELVSTLRLGKTDEFLLVTEARVGEQTCEGVLFFSDEDRDQLVGRFTEKPASDEEPGAEPVLCTGWSARRLVVDLDRFPAAPLSNGKTQVAFVDGKAIVTELGEGGSRCEMDVLRTESLSTTSRYSPAFAFFGGELANLVPAEPTSTSESCQDKLVGSCVQEGIGYDPFGEPLTAAAAGLDAAGVEALEAACEGAGTHLTCPDALVVKEESSTTFKVGATPAHIMRQACFDFTGEFSPGE